MEEAEKKPSSQSISLLISRGVRAAESRRSFVLMEACIIGAAAAVAVLFFSKGITVVTSVRTALCTVLPPEVVLPGLGMLGGIICGCFVKFVAPEVSGSGIPQVKAFLVGFPMKLDIRVAISKLVSGVIALGVGFPLGREGPTVQVGGATAAVLGRVGYQSPRNRRQLIAAGAGAGLAAAFNAPLAGVMFVVEELSKNVSSLAIGTALVACFFAGIVARYLGNHSLDMSPSTLYPRASFLISNVPFCVALGMVSGVVGAYFNNAIIWSMKMHDRIFKERYLLRCGLAGLACGLIIAFLPESFRDLNGVKQLIFQGKSWRFAIVALLANFLLTVWAYGSGVPGGLFAPSLNIGACIGALVGLGEMHILGTASTPLTLELAGMGAFFAAVARVPITATVVVFEMTADFNLLLPLMICSITAFFVSEKVSPGSIYDRLLALKGFDIGSMDENDPLSNLFVRDAMTINIKPVDSKTPIKDIMGRIERHVGKSLPVFEEGKLCGLVSQIDLITKRQLLTDDAMVCKVMTPDVVTVTPDQRLHDALGLFDEQGLFNLPVIDPDGNYCGMLTRPDIIRVLRQQTRKE